jgi:hypothetical protein
MLNSNAQCQVSSKVGYDVYGTAIMSPAITESCAVVRLKVNTMGTPMRAESSATHGHAWEFIQNNQILLSGDTSARTGDRIDLFGLSFRITGMSPVVDVLGSRVDHYTVTGDVWA